MKRISSLFVAAILLASLCSCVQNTEEQWQKQYDLGVRYLSEGNYEEAVIAFTAAIEIDPKQPDAYLKVAEAYVSMGDIDSAMAILEQGYELIQDERISEQLQVLQDSYADYSVYFSENIVAQEELTLGGRPFYMISFDQLPTVLTQPDGSEGYVEESTDADGEVAVRRYTIVQENSGTTVCEQYVESSTLKSLSYYDYYGGKFIYVDTEIRGISTGDTMQAVLEKIGVLPEGALILSQLNKSILIGADQTIDNGYGWIQASDEKGSVDGAETIYVNVYLNTVNVQMDFQNGCLVSLSCYSR